MANVIDSLDAKDLIERYRSGTSLKKLATEVGCSRDVLYRLFALHHVEMRSRSEAETLKWRSLKKSPSAVRKQLSRAWDAVRGSKRSRDELRRRALTKCRRVGRFERELVEALSSRGLRVDEQLPIGPYNVDLAVESRRLAVEVVSCSMGATATRRLTKRVEHILGTGRSLVFVVTHTSTAGFDAEVVSDKLIALSKLSRRNESPRGQYGVIRGDGKPATFSRRELDHLPRIPGA